MRYALAVVFSFIAVTIAPAWAQQDRDRGRASRIELYGGYEYTGGPAWQKRTPAVGAV